MLRGDFKEALKSRHGEHRISAPNGEEHVAEWWAPGWWVLSLRMDGKHQPDVTSCESSSGASYLLVQAMTS